MSEKKENHLTMSVINEEKHVMEVYNTIAQEFSNSRSYSWSWVTNFVESFPKGSMIYDIGCGSGRNMNYESYNFIGIDNCEEFVKISRKKGYNVVQSNMTSIPLHDKSCDGLMCVAAFHHLSTRKRRIDALCEMKRLIRDNGRILISVWSKTQPAKTRRVFEHYGDTMVPWKKNNDEIHDRYYYIFKKDEIEELFKEAGLSIIDHSWNVGNEVYLLTKSE